jgi:hypothetical protein
MPLRIARLLAIALGLIAMSVHRSQAWTLNAAPTITLHSTGQIDVLLRDLMGPDHPDPSVDPVMKTLVGQYQSSPSQSSWGILTSGMLNHPAYKTYLIQSLFRQLLRRTADPAGLAFFTNATGMTDEQMIASIAGSPEYFQNRGGGTNDGFIQAAYLDLFRRAADSNGLAYYKALMSQAAQGGATQSQAQTQVILSLTSSAEYKQRLENALFLRFLDRPADQAALAFFSQALQAGMTDEQAIQLIVAPLSGSQEYFQMPEPIGVYSGPVATVVPVITVGSPDAYAAQVTAKIDWGDSRTPSPDPTTVDFVNSDGTITVWGSHKYVVFGSYPVKVTVTDANNNSQTVTGTLNFSPQGLPTLTASKATTTLPSGQPGAHDITFTATNGEGDPNATPIWSLDNALQPGNNASTFTPFLSLGAHTIKVSYPPIPTDGNAPRTASLQVMVKAPITPPTLTASKSATYAPYGQTEASDITFTAHDGAGDPPADLAWYVDDAQQDGATASTLTPALAIGDHTVRVTYTNTDGTGDPRSASVQVTVNAPIAPPTLTASKMKTTAPYGTTAASDITFTATNGEGNPDSTPTWYVDDDEQAGASDPTFVPVLKVGAHTVIVTYPVLDDGATRSVSVQVTVSAPRPIAVRLGDRITPFSDFGSLPGQPSGLTLALNPGAPATDSVAAVPASLFVAATTGLFQASSLAPQTLYSPYSATASANEGMLQGMGIRPAKGGYEFVGPWGFPLLASADIAPSTLTDPLAKLKAQSASLSGIKLGAYGGNLDSANTDFADALNQIGDVSDPDFTDLNMAQPLLATVTGADNDPIFVTKDNALVRPKFADFTAATDLTAAGQPIVDAIDHLYPSGSSPDPALVSPLAASSPFLVNGYDTWVAAHPTQADGPFVSVIPAPKNYDIDYLAATSTGLYSISADGSTVAPYELPSGSPDLTGITALRAGVGDVVYITTRGKADVPADGAVYSLAPNKFSILTLTPLVTQVDATDVYLDLKGDIGGGLFVADARDVKSGDPALGGAIWRFQQPPSIVPSPRISLNIPDPPIVKDVPFHYEIYVSNSPTAEVPNPCPLKSIKLYFVPPGKDGIPDPTQSVQILPTTDTSIGFDPPLADPSQTTPLAVGDSLTVTGSYTVTDAFNADVDNIITSVSLGGSCADVKPLGGLPGGADGKVTVQTAIALIKWLVDPKHNTLTPAEKLAADVNGDGKIDISDVIAFLRIAVGLDVNLG